MKIEAGKYYLTRRGLIVGPLTRVSWCDRTFAASDITWKENGSYVQNITHTLDLISEVYVSDTPPGLTATTITNQSYAMPEAKTLRDEFAMAALTGLLANAVDDGSMGAEDWASDAYLFADKMLEARKK
jgi:hypothetical protein